MLVPPFNFLTSVVEIITVGGVVFVLTDEVRYFEGFRLVAAAHA